MVNKDYRKQTGSVLVYVVVVMVISLVIAGGLYILSSTTSYTVPFVKLGQRAFYLAEAGYRYAASEFLTSKNFEDQIEILERLDNSTYHFDDGSSFTLHVYPYFFILDQNYSKATKVTLKTPGTIPPQMNFPETGMLQIGVENDPYRYSNGKKISNNQVQVVLDRPLTAKKYDPVFFAFYPNNNQFVEYGGELKLNWDEDKISIFPDRNGYFEIKDKGAFNYDFKRRGSVILSGIKKYTESKKHYEEFATFEVTPSDIVILKPNVKILSKGTVSSLSFLSSSRKISYYVPITEDYYSSGGGTQVLQLSDEPGGQDKFDNLKNWITTDNTHKYVTTKANIGSNHGWSKNWATYHNLPDDGFILPFKSSKFNEIEEYWKSHRKTLTYTAQVKVGWGYKLEYGATGLNFRWHENEDYKGLYEGYGISFMRYKQKNESENDYIPNAIKPKYGMENDLHDKLLIVLWRQKVVNGAIKRDWIAYKDVTNDEKLLGDSWDYSGRLEDLSTISVQVYEKIIAGQKVNDVKIFYGDASTAQDEPHNPDYLYNNTNRAAYNPTYSDVSITDIKWPLWDLNAWDPDHDYFTLVCNVPVGENPTYDGNDYWIINPEIDEAKLLPDGSTIRLTGFTSPDGDKFISGDAHSRPEIAIHAYGDINSLNSQTFVSFSEFAISLGADGEEDSSRGGFGRLK